MNKYFVGLGALVYAMSAAPSFAQERPNSPLTATLGGVIHHKFTGEKDFCVYFNGILPAILRFPKQHITSIPGNNGTSLYFVDIVVKDKDGIKKIETNWTNENHVYLFTISYKNRDNGLWQDDRIGNYHILKDGEKLPDLEILVEDGYGRKEKIVITADTIKQFADGNIPGYTTTEADRGKCEKIVW